MCDAFVNCPIVIKCLQKNEGELTEELCVKDIFVQLGPYGKSVVILTTERLSNENVAGYTMISETETSQLSQMCGSVE